MVPERRTEYSAQNTLEKKNQWLEQQPTIVRGLDAKASSPGASCNRSSGDADGSAGAVVSLSQQLSAPKGTARAGTLHRAGRGRGPGSMHLFISCLKPEAGKVVGAWIFLCEVPEEQARPHFLRPSASSGKLQGSQSRRIQDTPEARKGTK